MMGQVAFQAPKERCRFETDRAMRTLIQETDIRQADEAVYLCVREEAHMIPLQVGL